MATSIVQGKDPVGSGIYCIKNTVNGRVYVGQSVNMAARIKQHKKDLSKGTHHNHLLLNDWKECGCEAFEFTALESVTPIKELLDRKENEWIHRLKSLNPECGYNLTYNGSAGEVTAYPCENIQLGQWTAIRRLTDGYWCASALCDQFGKRADNWTRLNPEFSHLIKKSTDSHDKGVWIHPDLVLMLVMWLSPRLYFAFMKYLRLKVGQQAINQAIANALNDAQNRDDIREMYGR